MNGIELIVGLVIGGLIPFFYVRRRQQIFSQEKILSQRLLTSERISGVGSWEWDTLRNTVWWSDEEYRLFGVDQKKFVPTYTNYLEMIHPDDHEAVVQHVQDVINGKKTDAHDYRIVRPNGSVIWITSKREATLDDTGRMTWMTGIDQEITERINAANALQESKDQFRAIFDQTFQFIGLLTVDGVITEVNRTVLSALGIEETDVIGKLFWETPAWNHEQNQQLKVRLAVSSASQGEVVRFEACHPIPDGSMIWVDFSLKPYRDRDGQIRWLIAEGRDITERKRTEAELRESRSRFERAVNGSRDGIWEWDILNNQVYFSPRWKEMLEYDDADIPNNFSAWEALVHPEDLPRVLRGLEEYQQGNIKSYEPEFRMRTKSGDWRWILSRGVSIRDKNGKPILMSGSHTDVTQRRIEAEQLQSNRLLLTQFIQYAPAAIAMLDNQMKYVRTSERWLRDFKLDTQTIIGKSHYEIFPNLPERWILCHQRVLAGAIERCDEDAFTLPDGKLEWVQWEARPWHKASGEVGGMMLFSQVITERKLAEAALRESEERYRSAVNSVAEGIVVQDMRGVILTCNERAEQILGMTRDQIAGKSSLDPDWRSIHQDGSPFPGDQHPAMITLRTGKPVSNVVMGVQKSSGETTWIVINAVPVQNRQGSKEAAVVTSFHDITESRRLNEQLRQSLREKEVMLQEIHHRVKNNLAITISLFNFQMRGMHDSRGKDALKQAQERVRTMALVHEMLYQTPSMTQVEMRPYVNQLLRHLRDSYSLNQRVQTSVDADPVALPLQAAIPFGLILNELVSNAFKYAFPDDRRGSLTISLKNADGMLTLCVHDDGSGLPIDYSPTESKSLGLTLVRELARQINGEFQIIQDHGCRFQIVFPLNPKEEIEPINAY